MDEREFFGKTLDRAIASRRKSDVWLCTGGRPNGVPPARFEAGCPSLIVCLEGEGEYELNQGGAVARRVLRPCDAIVRSGGSWINVCPRTEYRSLGIQFHAYATRMYVVACRMAGDGQVRPTLPHPHEFYGHAPLAGDGHLVCQALLATGKRAPDAPHRRELLRLLLRNARETLDHRAAVSGAKAASTYRALVQFVEDHYDEPIGRAEAASALRIHPRHVSRLFQRFGDEKFTSFVRRTRVERARELLKEPNLTVSEIGARCGFSSPNFFVRAFREVYGAAPGRYRRRSVR